MTIKAPDLSGFRNQIDRIDAQIVALLRERAGVVSSVAKVKASSASYGDGVFLDPKREFFLIDSILKKHESVDENYKASLITDVWRLMVSASNQLEQEIKIGALLSKKDEFKTQNYLNALHFYGFFSKIVQYESVQKILDDIRYGNVNIAFFPYGRNLQKESKNIPWWVKLYYSKKECQQMNVFAVAPFDKNTLPNYRRSLLLAKIDITPYVAEKCFKNLIVVKESSISVDSVVKLLESQAIKTTWLKTYGDLQKGLINPENKTFRYHMLTCESEDFTIEKLNDAEQKAQKLNTENENSVNFLPIGGYFD